MTIVHIAIGNSDDKLSQRDWSKFQTDVVDLFLSDEDNHTDFTTDIHGIWYSFPTSPYQNMCICVDIPDEVFLEVKEVLSGLAKEYNQHFIQWTVADPNRSGGIEPKE